MLNNGRWDDAQAIFNDHQGLANEILLFPEQYLPKLDHEYDIEDYSQAIQLGLWKGACHLSREHILDKDEQSKILMAHITAEIHILDSEFRGGHIDYILSSHVTIESGEKMEVSELLSDCECSGLCKKICNYNNCKNSDNDN